MPDNKPTLLVIPGDGIGPEVIRQAMRVVDWFEQNRTIALDIKDGELGVATYHKSGAMLPDETVSGAQAADAVLFGAIGGDGYDEIPIEVRREGGLLAMRHTFDAADYAELIESAVKDTVARGMRTADIKGDATRAVSTTQMGDAVLGSLDRLAA